jgi:MOSC domain-containing protein YiiM
MSDGSVTAVNRSGEYSFSKPGREQIVLVPGLGVQGDVHAGVTVRHRSRVRADPHQPNMRQVHLIQGELFHEVGEQGYTVSPGNLGENVTTRGLDLLGLPRGAVLRFGVEAKSEGGGQNEGEGENGSARDVIAAARRVTLSAESERAVAALEAAVEREAGFDQRPAVVITGLRNPCGQIDNFEEGLLGEVAYKDEEGRFVRKAGVMGVVLRGGVVRPGDPVTVDLPPAPHEALDRV